MFLVQAMSKCGIWNNNKEDDFIRFLPNYFNCSPSNLIIHFIPKEIKNELDEYSSNPKQRVEYFNGKAKKFKKITVTVDEVVLNLETNENEIKQKEVEEEIEDGEIVFIPIKNSWPYTEVNNNLIFNGIELGV